MTINSNQKDTQQVKPYRPHENMVQIAAVAIELRRARNELKQLKAERNALRTAIRFLFDHGAYLTERVPDELQAAIDAARSKT